MLQHLKIRNLALLSEVTLELEGGFHAVTGETGAGKSVLLGALALLSGGKADKEHIRQGEEECGLEALLFFPEGHSIHAVLEELGLPACEEGTLIIQRELSRKKAGKVLINGRLTTLANLRKIGEQWIDFHGPGEPQKLFYQENQRILLDRYGALRTEHERYLTAYQAWRAALREIARIQSEDRLSEQELKAMRNELQALSALEMTEEAVLKLEQEFERWQKSSELQRLVYGIEEGVTGAEGVIQALRTVLQLSSELTELDESREDWERRFRSAMIDLEDLGSDLRYARTDYEWDESSAQELQTKMALWLRTKRRYGPEVDQVLKNIQAMSDKLNLQENLEGILIQKEHEAEVLKVEVMREGKQLSEKRKQIAEKLERAVNPLLAQLGFKKASFCVQFEPLEQPEIQGIEGLRFYFSANPGQEPLPLDRIASSGELARVMLALKTLLAEVDDTPVLVFDEVDANVGGEIGAVVGMQLASISKERQVFCITHLPQVAAQGTWHWLVEKTSKEDSTEIQILPLTEKGSGESRRIEELARMLGDRNAQSAKDHARALLR